MQTHLLLARPLSSALIGALVLASCSKKDEAAPSAQQAPSAQTAPSAPAKPPLTPVPAPPADELKGPPASATKLPSGIAFVVLKPGTGTEHPTENDDATVNYSLWLTNGQLFDSTIPKNQPAVFPLLKIPEGWKLATEQLVVGQKARFWIPEELAFKGRPGPQGLNILELELVSIHKGPEQDPVPPDVAAPPADATKLPDGLAMKVLKPGDGKTFPQLNSNLSVKYTGWTTDGKMFDSSRGRPVTMPLTRLIEGWKEGLQKMSVGERARLWIPAKLAYEGKNGPQGMLVFDVELLEIK